MTVQPAVRRKANANGSSAALWVQFRELGILVFVAAVVMVATISEPKFLSPGNIRNIALYIPLITVIAMGEMMVIITRNVDLSVGSILAFTALFFGDLFVEDPVFPIWLAALIGVLVGAIMGAINGILVTKLHIPGIIATLGTLSAYRGMSFIYNGGRQVNAQDLPPEVISLAQTSPIGVPWIIIFAALIVFATFLFLRYSRLGREIYAFGSNPLAATLRGIAVDRVILLVFTLTGALSGVAGIMYAARFGYVNPGDTATGFELVVISATVIGGTNVFGGSGSVLGTLLGCLLLGVVNVALSVLGVSAFWQLATYGFAILLAVTVDGFIQRQLGRRLSGGTS